MFHSSTPQHARCPSSWFKGKKPLPPTKIQFYILIFKLGSGSVDCHRYIAVYPGLASECDIYGIAINWRYIHKRVWPLDTRHQPAYLIFLSTYLQDCVPLSLSLYWQFAPAYFHFPFLWQKVSYLLSAYFQDSHFHFPYIGNLQQPFFITLAMLWRKHS